MKKDWNFPLTSNIKLGEFFVGDMKSFYNAEQVFNSKLSNHLTNIALVLQTLRNHFNMPLRITSGVRTPEYNLRVGGSKNSQHIYWNAADFTIDGIDAEVVQKFIVSNRDRLFPQIGGLGKGETFTHIDLREEGELIQWTY